MKKLFLTLALTLAFTHAMAADSPFSGTNSKAPIEIDADALEVFQEQKKAIFSGNVIAKQGTMTVKSSKMTVFYAGEGTSGNSISRIELDGNVVLSTPTENAKSQKGSYDTKNNFVTLTGDVTLTKDSNILKGNKLEYDIDSGHSKLDSAGVTAGGTTTTGGRVRGLFIPQK